MRKAIWVVLPIVLLAAGAVGASYLIRTKPTLEPSPSTERVWAVDTVTVRLRDVQPEIRLFGTIFAAREIQLRALVPGQVVEVHPDLVEGGLVRRGEAIVAIDEFEYRATLKESEARLTEARGRLAETEAGRLAETEALRSDREILALLERDMKRSEQLSARGNISNQALDHKRLEVRRQERDIVVRQNAIDSAAARLDQEKAVVERLGVAVDRARYDLERTRLQAPFDGVFREAAVQVGQRLDINDRIGTLTDTGRLEARFHVSDAQYGRLTATEQGVVGRKGKVIWSAGQHRIVLDARVARVGARIEAVTGGVELFARIADREAASPMRPGAFVEVVIPDRSYSSVARVPETVLHPGEIAYGVVDDRLVPRRTEVVGRIGNDVLLRGEIGDGVRLVTTQSATITPGLRVEPR